MAENNNIYHCPVSGCSFVSSTPNEWLTHLRNIDHHQPFNVDCCIRDCSKSFKSFSGLKSHLYRKHYVKRIADESNEDAISEREDNEEIVNDFATDFAIEMDIESVNDDLEADVSRLLGTDLQLQKRESALFLMRLREVRRISQASIDEVVSGCKDLFESTAKRLQAGVRQKLAENGIELPAINEVFDELKDPFTGLESLYLQEKYMSKEFYIIVSLGPWHSLLAFSLGVYP